MTASAASVALFQVCSVVPRYARGPESMMVGFLVHTEVRVIGAYAGGTCGWWRWLAVCISTKVKNAYGGNEVQEVNVLAMSP